MSIAGGMFALAACGGGGSLVAQPVPARPTDVKTGTITLSIAWPAVAAPSDSHAGRGRAYLSKRTLSVSIAVGNATAMVFDNPNVAGSPLQTQQNGITAPAALDDVTLASHDGVGATGDLFLRSR